MPTLITAAWLSVAIAGRAQDAPTLTPAAPMDRNIEQGREIC